ncbi:MAG: FAD:protein FMN transferase [Clostridia bacterium]|nr:FAD:protein FMN transferase [Clostridia bacterium]
MEKLKKVFPILAVLLVIIIFIVSFFGSLTTDSEASGFIMGSPVDIKVYNEKNGDTLCADALERIKFIDRVYLSHTNSTSAVSILNRDGELISDKWFAEYLDACLDLIHESKSNSFTLFSGEFKDLWKIEEGGYIPTSDELAQVLENHKNSLIAIDDDNNKISIDTGKLDLGALGKGTACDEAINYLKKQKVEKALVTVGGSIGMIGAEPFSIGVRNPFGNKNEYFAVLNITDCFVSTSGDYEKYFEKDGVRYSHIFDATTGSPVQNDISSVTVVANNGMLSDFLSTVIYIEGIEKGVKIAEIFDASVVIVKKDKTVLVSKELKDKFTLKDDSFSVSVIE